MNELNQIVLGKISEGDIVHKVFLKPIELLLRTHKIDRTMCQRDLPQGLMMALKINGISDNAYEPLAFPTIDPTATLEATCEENADNLISFLKNRPEKEGEETSKGL
jgi:hypothetical protein